MPKGDQSDEGRGIVLRNWWRAGHDVAYRRFMMINESLHSSVRDSLNDGYGAA